LTYDGKSYRLIAYVAKDDLTSVSTPMNGFVIDNKPHMVEMDWQASSASGADNGYFSIWVDGVQSSLTGLDNDTLRIKYMRLGAVSGILSDTRGIIYFDSFESHRQTAIGPDLAAATPTLTATGIARPTITPVPSGTPTYTPSPAPTPLGPLTINYTYDPLDHRRLFRR
jgi:hypothetical protein